LKHPELTVLAAAFLAVSAAKSVCGESPSARLTSEQLRGRLLDTQQKIRSVYVEYRSGKYNEERFPKGTYLHRIVAAKTP
jgi:hypothetical protein